MLWASPRHLQVNGCRVSSCQSSKNGILLEHTGLCRLVVAMAGPARLVSQPVSRPLFLSECLHALTEQSERERETVSRETFSIIKQGLSAGPCIAAVQRAGCAQLYRGRTVPAPADAPVQLMHEQPDLLSDETYGPEGTLYTLHPTLYTLHPTC